MRHFYVKIDFKLILFFVCAAIASCKKEAVQIEEPLKTNHYATSSQNSSLKKAEKAEQFRYLGDLRGGDILLQVADPETTDMRRIAQRLTGSGSSHSKIVHAGIMSNNYNIVEAGLSKRQIWLRPGTWVVYRAIDPKMAEGAATAATLLRDIHRRHNSIKYPDDLRKLLPCVLLPPSKPKSADEMDDFYERIMKDQNSPMFCSQLVVYIYQWVATQSGIPAEKVFNIKDNRTSPARLAKILEGSSQFTRLGQFSVDYK